MCVLLVIAFAREKAVEKDFSRRLLIFVIKTEIQDLERDVCRTNAGTFLASLRSVRVIMLVKI